MKKNSFLAFFFALTLIVGMCFINNTVIYAADDFEIGVSNLNNTEENSAKIGELLLKPEKGWKRYDDTNSKIFYDSSWSYCTRFKNTYKEGYMSSAVVGAVSKFKFSGDKLRIITWRAYNNSGINIKIDNVDYGKFSNCTSNYSGYYLLFEKLDLHEGIHEVEIKTFEKSTGSYFALDAIEINEDGELQKYDNSVLVEANKTLNLKDETIELETGYSKNLSVDVNPLDSKLIWSSSDESIATVDQTGKVTAVKEGESTITVKMNGTDLKDSCKVIVSKSEEPQPSNNLILNIEPEKEKINLNQNVTANVVMDNIKEIAAEDMIIKYDSEKLKFLGAEEVEGIKIIKSFENKGELRVILASQGISNAVFMKKTLLKLNFQGIAVGDAVVDITKGKISDGIQMERNLADTECGQATISIEDYKDPNKDGAFTLLDLAIDGRYYGLNPADYPQYKTDVVENGEIDDDDLLQIGQYMMENPNYSFNN